MYKLIYHTVFSIDGTKEFRTPKGVVIGGKEIILPCSIATHSDNETPFIVEVNDLVIVCFDPWNKAEREEVKKLGVNLERNIWAFDLNGNKMWEIAEPTVKIYKLNSYTSVFIKDGQVRAYNTAGIYYIVDIKNGNVKPVPDQGRPW